MPNIIIPKKRYTTGSPSASQLQQGEIAINLFDKKIYSKDSNNNVILLGSGNGDSSQKFKVATATANDEAVNKSQLDTKAEKGGSSTQVFKVKNATANDEAVNKSQLDTKAEKGGSSTQVFKVKNATANDEAVNLEQLNTAVGSINQNLFIKPTSRYNKVLFIKTSPSSIVIPAGFKVAVGNNLILVASDYTLNLNSNLDAGSKTPGKDYYVYATPAGAFYLSANSTITTDRLIGGFHYGLTGESEVLPLNALRTEADMIANRGIKAYSMWDLAWKPANKRPEGKVLVNDLFWRDIYPADENYGIRGYSSCFALDGTTPAKLAGGAETSGRKFPKIPLSKGGNGTLNYGSLTWYEANEIISEVGMRMISYDEFSNSSYGVVEQKSLSQLGYTIGTGIIQHYPELESKWGVEMAVGCQWFWTKELMNGYGSTDFANRTGLTDGRGYLYSTSNSPVAGIVGGQEQHVSTSPVGSRALGLSSYVWDTSWYNGFVAVCDHMNLDK